MAELVKYNQLTKLRVSRVSKVWEDNEAALKHAVTPLPKMTPRTKHIGVKYHWFKSKVVLGSGIEIHPINTKQQKADLMTKGLSKGEFESERSLVMGW